MNSFEKLQKDLHVLEKFAELTGEYLGTEKLFYHVGPHYPEMTFGGYLLRQYRLVALRNLLDSAENLRLDQAISLFSQQIKESVVRFEAHCLYELKARLRQWSENEAEWQLRPNMLTYYATSVEPRVMITHLLDVMSQPPYRIDPNFSHQVTILDNSLKARWEGDQFVWAPEWQVAYPQTTFWFLYGKPYVRKSDW